MACLFPIHFCELDYTLSMKCNFNEKTMRKRHGFKETMRLFCFITYKKQVHKAVNCGHDNSKSTKEVKTMNHSQCNKAIRCTVSQCANHCDSAEYCALDCITVGTHEANPTVDQCTHC